jgi:hypothetical protein
MSESFVRETLADLRARAVTSENADLIATASGLAIMLGTAWKRQDELDARVHLAEESVSLSHARTKQVCEAAKAVIDGIEMMGHHSQHDLRVLKEVIGWHSSRPSRA